MNNQKKINYPQNIIAIIGLGNVGLNLLLKSANHFDKIIGIDINQERINLLNTGKSYLDYVTNDEIESLSNVVFTTNYSHIQNANIVCLCLPTTSTSAKSETQTFERALIKALNFIKPNSLLISESTLPVGFHSNFIIPTINRYFSLGQNIFLGYSPERINPGKISEYPQTNTRIFTGFCSRSKMLTKNFYQNFVPFLLEMSDFNATEFTKIFENAYRALNIAFVDEVKYITDKLNLNIYEIIGGAQSKGISFEPHFPSSGIGGACIPMSLDYLEEIARKTESNANIVHQARIQNQFKINQIIDSIKQHRNILILGASYKKNLADLTRSSTISIIEAIQDYSLNITLCDPYFKNKDFDNLNIKFINSFKTLDIASFDAVLLMVEHHEFDLQKIKRKAQRLIDPKGLCLLL